MTWSIHSLLKTNYDHFDGVGRSEEANSDQNKGDHRFNLKDKSSSKQGFEINRFSFVIMGRTQFNTKHN